MATPNILTALNQGAPSFRHQPRLPNRGDAPRRLWTALALMLCTLAASSFVQADTFLEAGQRAYDRGDFAQAVVEWRSALENRRRAGDLAAEIQAGLVLAGAYQAIGHQRRALNTLQESVARSPAAGDAALLARAEARLGGALVIMRDLDQAKALLDRALVAARAAGDIALEAEVLNDLGNLRLAQEQPALAWAAYDAALTSARRAPNPWLAAQALGNASAAALQAGDFSAADSLNQRAVDALDALPPSHAKALLYLKAAQTDHDLVLSAATAAEPMLLRAHGSLLRALDLADTLQNGAIETYALGYLGRLYERDGQTDAALSMTRQAVFAAQRAQLPDALFRWEWQAARLLQAHGETQAAIDAYRRAVQTMEPIRSDVSLAFGNTASRRSFQEEEGALFLELATLLLQAAETAADPSRAQELLREARDTVEHLKAVELEDYFCDECVDVQRARIRPVEAVAEHTAVVYFVPLPTRMVALVGLNSGLTQFSLPVGSADLTREVNQFRRNLETRTTFAYLEQAQRLYDWLIRPFLTHLRSQQVNTLVIVPDGNLRTMPFAALHDGENFLLREFAVAVSPGLSLVEPAPLQQQNARLLLGGLSESVQGFPPLDFVPSELSSLEQLYPGKQLINQEFTLHTLKQQLTESQYSIVHIASHGEFHRDASKTFILTYDGKLTLNDLEALIRPSQYRGRPVELLVLSACQTAVGDDRAALGLAGVGVKAGARSALATLWHVNDQSTSLLITELYRQLRDDPATSKAQALRAAQLKLAADRRYRHPCYWAPYLVIGNWL